MDTHYINNAQEDKRMRKTGWQKEYLEEEFKKSNVWTYAQKVQIAAHIGMNYHQVSKWNWDERKKHGISTKRTR